MKEYNPFQITIQFFNNKELLLQHSSAQIKYIIEHDNKFIIEFKNNQNYLFKENFKDEYYDKTKDYTNIIIETSQGLTYNFRKQYKSIDGITNVEVNNSQLIFTFSNNKFKETKGERKKYLKKKHNLK